MPAPIPSSARSSLVRYRPATISCAPCHCGRNYFEPRKDTADPDFLAALERLAFKLEATAVGYARIPPDYIYAGKAIPYDRAIVFTVEMDKAKIDTAPGYPAMIVTITSYHRLGIIANALTDLLREHGYGAYPGTAVGGLVNYVRTAELAGLGAGGYHGLLISPAGGSRQRIGLVYTNIANLPVPAENHHAWVRDLCAMCRKCTRECPVQAIYETPQAGPAGQVTFVDHPKCLAKFSIDYGCSVCVKVCPFSNVGYQAIKSRFKDTKTRTHSKVSA
jgi:ferredoxin